MDQLLQQWIYAEPGEIGMVILSSFVVYIAIIVYARLTGLRSFSKMSSADFAMTVAVGSLFASTISAPNPALFLGLIALGCLHLGQWMFASLRQWSKTISQVVDNQPILLMDRHGLIEKNLQAANVTPADLYSKLRAANVLNYDQIIAVVFETTGDVSVMHSKDPNVNVRPEFFKGVIDSERLFEESAAKAA